MDYDTVSVQYLLKKVNITINHTEQKIYDKVFFLCGLPALRTYIKIHIGLIVYLSISVKNHQPRAPTTCHSKANIY